MLAGCAGKDRADSGSQSDSVGPTDSAADTGQPEALPELGQCGNLASPMVISAVDSVVLGSKPAIPFSRAFTLTSHNTVPLSSGDCPEILTSVTTEVSAVGGCTNAAGSEFSGAYELSVDNPTATTRLNWSFFDWEASFADSSGHVRYWLNGTTYLGLEPEYSVDNQLWFEVSSSGPYELPLADEVAYHDVSGELTDTDWTWSGYFYAVEATWADTPGDFCIEASLTWDKACEAEPDGEVLLEADHSYRWVLDGSTACDGCGTLYVDGAESGTTCL